MRLSRTRVRLSLASNSRSRGFNVGLQTLLTGMLILVLNLVTGVITARALSPAGRGEMMAIVLWPQFIAFTLTLGIPTSLLYNIKKFPREEGEFLAATMLLGLILGALSIGVGVAVIPMQLGVYPQSLIRFAQWAMVAAPLAFINVVVSCVLMARDQFLAYNLLRLSQPLMAVVLIAAAWMGGALNPYSAATAVLIAYLPPIAWVLAEFRRRPPRSAGVVDASKRLLSYGLRAYGADLVATLSDYLDRVLIVGVVNPVMMGLYVVGANLAQALRMVPAATVTVLFPKAAGQSQEETVALTGRAVRATLAAMVVTAVAAALAGPFVIATFYGSEFIGAVPVMRVLLADVLIRGVVRVLAQAFMASGRPGLVSIVQGVTIGVSIPLVLLLVPRYGLVGAGLGMLIASAFQLIVTLACFPLVLRHRVPRLRITLDEVASFLRRR